MHAETLAHLERLFEAKLELVLQEHELTGFNEFQRDRWLEQARESRKVLLSPTNEV